MDPLSPPLLIVWAVMALASVLLGGCLRTNGYAEPVYYSPPPFYGAPPAQPAQPAYYQPRPITSCITIGNFVTCS